MSDYGSAARQAPARQLAADILTPALIGIEEFGRSLFIPETDMTILFFQRQERVSSL